MSKSLSLSIAVVLSALSGCGDALLSPSEVRALASARAKWEAAGLSNYVVEQRVSCFCSPHLNFITRVSVTGNVVVAAEPLDPLPEGIEPNLLGWTTVEGAFEVIENARRSSHLRRLDVDFDPVLGYPTRIDQTCKPGILDCGVVYTLRNLTPTS